MSRLASELAVVASPLTFSHVETRKTRLFVADGHPSILESVNAVFRSFDATVNVTAFAAVAELEAAMDMGAAPDLVLVEFDIPGLATIDAVADFIGRHCDIPIGVTSGHADRRLARELLYVGCRGFVPKSLAYRAFYHAVNRMIAGNRFVPDFPDGTLVPGSIAVPSLHRSAAMPPGWRGR